MISADQTGKSTDWDRYYANVPPTAKLTRKHTTAVLINMIKRYATAADRRAGLSIVEVGGANSCFLDSIMESVRVASYDIIDTNEFGLSLTARGKNGHAVRLHHGSILDLPFARNADLVFSVGLIEHFQPDNTGKAILAHLNLVRPGGTIILTFPTPTVLYRATRGLIEAIGQWRFPDERPLSFQEVASVLRTRTTIVHTKLLWPLVLTQQLVVACKPDSAQTAIG